MSGTPGQATGRVICPVLASAGGRCVSGTLGSTKIFFFWRTRLWGCPRTTAQVARVDRTVSHVWYTGSVLPGRLNKPRWDRDRRCLPISQAVGGGSHGQVVPACANPQTLRLTGVDGVFQSPLSSPITVAGRTRFGWGRPRCDYAYMIGPQERKIRVSAA